MILIQTISIPHRRFHGGTMTMFLRNVIHEHCCGFPRDLEGQATFERLAAVSRLQHILSFRSVMPIIRDNSLRCDLFISLAMSCIISITQLDMLIPYSRQQNVPRAF